MACLTTTASAEVRAAKIFTDHMVLQRGVELPIWGWTEPGETVAVEFADQRKTAVSDATGKWLVHLDPLPASAQGRSLVVASTLIIRGECGNRFG